MIVSGKLRATKSGTSGKMVANKMRVMDNSVSAYCSLMSWTSSYEQNSTGVFDGIELTITNDGMGAGSYIASGNTTVTSSTGNLSIECRFKSSSANTSTHNIYLIQGVTTVCGLSYQPATQVLKDLVTLGNVATGLTGGADYTFGFKLNQAAGTCTFSDSEANSGSLSVDAAYSNATASIIATGGGTGVSEVGVHEVNVGTQAFWLAASDGRYCDYS